MCPTVTSTKALTFCWRIIMLDEANWILIQAHTYVIFIRGSHVSKSVWPANLWRWISALMSTCSLPWCSVPLLGLGGGEKKGDREGHPPFPPEGNLGSLHLPARVAGDSTRGCAPLAGFGGVPHLPFSPPKSVVKGFERAIFRRNPINKTQQTLLREC